MDPPPVIAPGQSDRGTLNAEEFAVAENNAVATADVADEELGQLELGAFVENVPLESAADETGESEDSSILHDRLSRKGCISELTPAQEEGSIRVEEEDEKIIRIGETKASDSDNSDGISSVPASSAARSRDVLAELDDCSLEAGLIYTKQGAPDSKYTVYHVLVDPEQLDQAAEIPLYSNARPHMRAFHLAWSSFFVAFFVWFAMTPLLSEIAHSLDLERSEIWTSSILAVASSAVTRCLIGPLNDKYGARWVMCGTLVACSIPTALSGWIVQDVTSLYLTRLFIGVAGSAFVTCEYWTSSMFTQEIAGTANALAAGWGNLG
jgi:hypothetical protein